MNGETLAENWAHAEHGEEVLGRLDGVHANRFAAVVREIDLRAPPRCGVLEYSIQPSVVAEVDRRDRLVFERLGVVHFPERDQSIWLRIGKWPKHHAAQEAEDAGRGAGTQTEREDGGDREARRASQCAR